MSDALSGLTNGAIEPHKTLEFGLVASERSVDWMASYIVGSYYFAQGSYELQGLIHDYTGNVFAEACSKFVEDKDYRREVQVATIAKISVALSGATGSDHVKMLQVDSDGVANLKSESLVQFMLIRKTWESKSAYSIATILHKMLEIDASHLQVIGGQNDSSGSTGVRAVVSHERFGQSIVLPPLLGFVQPRHEVFMRLFAEARACVPMEQGSPMANNILGILALQRKLGVANVPNWRPALK